LLDSGASSTLIRENWAKNLSTIQVAPTNWTTTAGTFKTTEQVKLQLILPELHEGKTICCNAHVANTLGIYDLIIGRDLLKSLGVIINFRLQTIEWDEMEIPMKPENALPQHSFYIKDSNVLDSATERIKHILEAKYEPADLNKLVTSCAHLNLPQQKQLKSLLYQFKDLFDGNLGTWKGDPYNIELKADATPYHARAYPIPKIHEATLKMEVDRLIKLGVLKKVNRSEWAAPTFIIPKKDGTVRFISDFRQLNTRIKRKPYPIPKIQDLLLKLEGFQYATSLDLNMGYYHIELTPFSRSLCTIVLPYGKYEYQRLPMGLCNSPDIFQEKMSNLMDDLEFCRAYIDDILVITKDSWEQHLVHLQTVFTRLQQAGLKVNATKSFFGKSELEYLGFWITRAGIQPLPKKINAILQIAAPTTKRELRRFIGMVNYYRDMWIRRSDILSPLTKLVSKTVKWSWTDAQQNAFDMMKKLLSREALLSYPDFSKPFDVYTDASHHQLGAVISQEQRPIAFYSRKLQPAQTRYTTTERELLAIVETLKEFRNILLGHHIRVYTDHKNLTYKNFNTERVMRWRLILEEFGPELLYIKGERNIVADALSRLGIDASTDFVDATSVEAQADLFGHSLMDLSPEIMPLKFKQLQAAQQQDSTLLLSSSDSPTFHIKSFCGGGKCRQLICYKDKIVVPESLQKRVVDWYHEILCHPGMTRTEETIRQHFWWRTLRQDVQSTCETCDICQRTKHSSIKYGHLPEKVAESNPWDILCVDMIGPYTFQRNGKKALTLWCVTMIDPATSWFEMKQVKDKEAITVASAVEQTWLTRYPWPTQVIFDKGKEFLGEFAAMVSNDYGIERKGITVRNPQANAIIERIHQTIANIIRTFEVQKDPYLDPDDPWSGILAATMFAVRATYHTTLQATPSQLVFGRDAILNTKFEANWNLIRTQKQKMIRKNNQKENSKRIAHEYKAHDRVLCVGKPTLSKFGKSPWEGPYEIVKVNNNGTVRLKKGIIIETINIRQIKPYHNSS
jgi:RNase H-like domain found in reverse transcriptase/Reverse transcriptase (RNA-dependent DNA polymerase)/Integrase zinc binding domain